MESDYVLSARIRSCHSCQPMAELRIKDGTYAVPAEVGINAPDRPLAIICEAPGAQEAATSRPLVGPAGRMFNQMLAEAGIDRSELVLLNRVRCRPPDNKLANTPEAIPNCEHWTVEELSAYNPAVVVVMGGTALTTVFGAKAKVGATRGRLRSTGEGSTYGARVWIATYHPAAIMRPTGRHNLPLVVQDLKLAKATWEAITCGE